MPDWPERLAELVEQRRDTPFAWGSHDCCLWAADAVQTITGHDTAAAWRGRYASEAEAEALMAGAAGLYGLVAQALEAQGIPQCPPALAQRGDQALVEHGNTLAMGVVLGEVVAVPGPDGLAYAPIGAIRRAWVT